MNPHLVFNNNRIEYRWYGDSAPERPVLVFLHEGLGSVAQWRDFPLELSRMTQCRSFAYSRIGYGNSSACALPRKVNFMHVEAIRILPAVLELAGIEKYILIGHSDGGSIGIIHSGYHQPAEQFGLITMAAHVFCEDLTVDSIAGAKKLYENTGLKEKLQKYHGKNTECAFRGWNDVWLNPVFMHFNIEKYLKKVHVPYLALQGTDDQYGTRLQMEVINDQCPVSKTEWIEGCGHAPHISETALTLDLMAYHINDLMT